MQFSIPLLLFCALLLLGFLFASCSAGGYQKEGNSWVWVEYNENVGKKVSWIPEADGESFRVLTDKNYAVDHQRVYLKGKLIPEAEPGSFEVLDKMGYARDRNRVFLDCERILFAEPGSFEVLDFPYARDARRVFCGTIPIPGIETGEVASFRATNTDALMAHMKSTVLCSHFIELNPDFKWLDTLGVSFVIVGDWGTGETPTKKFKAFKQVD